MIRRHVVAGAVGLVLAGAFAWAGIALHAEPHRTRHDRGAVTGAYFRGGVPTYDRELERGLVVAGGSWLELGATAQLRERASAMSDRFAELGLGYYMRGDVLRDGREVVLAYRVEHVAFVRVGGEAHRVLHLRRIDHQPIAYGALGMQADDLGDPVVLLDQVDEFVASHVAPVLAGAGYALDDRALASAAGDAIRRELGGRGPAEITRLVVATVRRHEARHDYDLELDPALPEPKVLAGKGPRARAELAAYLSQIANDPVTPQLALWNLTSLAMHGEHSGTAEAYVAAIVISGLAHARPPTGRLDRARLSQLALPLASLSDDELRAAARSLWLELYGQPLAAMVDAW